MRILVVLLIVFAACNEKKMIRKVTGERYVRVYWCFDPAKDSDQDYVEVEQKSDIPTWGITKPKMIALEAKKAIVGVTMSHDTIVIKVLKSFQSKDGIKRASEAFGYKVFIDKSGTENDLRLIPAGIESCQ